MYIGVGITIVNLCRKTCLTYKIHVVRKYRWEYIYVIGQLEGLQSCVIRLTR